MNRTTFLTGLVAAGLLSAPTTPIEGQSWEFSLGSTSVDLETREAFPFGGRQIPTGIALSGRVLPFGSGLSIEGVLSGAWRTREGSVCHGLIGPEGCPNEFVNYSGGVAFVSVGWLLPIPVSEVVALRVVPSVGVGAVRAHETGAITGRSASETQPAVRFGTGVEITWSLGEAWYLVAGASRHEARARTPRCEDCGRLVGGRSSQTQLMVGLGLRR